MSSTTIFTPPYPLNTAVLLLVFNRLDTTQQVFQAIRQAKPPKLYIAADGARDNRADDDQKVQAVREYVTKNIDWECDVKTLFREKNYGCRLAVSSAIDWFFENEEMGIILEDDCLPSQSFFWFCEEMLNEYKNEESIYGISGSGRVTQFKKLEADYTFLKYPEIWGWATWRRVWNQYDVQMKDWPEYRKNKLSEISSLKETKRFWDHGIEDVFQGNTDTWDVQFCFQILKNKGKFIIPQWNLIENIGAGHIDATNGQSKDDRTTKIPIYEITFPLSKPQTISFDDDLNGIFDKYYYTRPSYFIKRVKRIFKLFYKLNVIKRPWPQTVLEKS